MEKIKQEKKHIGIIEYEFFIVFFAIIIWKENLV